MLGPCGSMRRGLGLRGGRGGGKRVLRLLAGSHQAALSGVHPVASSGVITLSIPHPSQATDPPTVLQGPQEDRPREARLPAMPSLSLRLEQTPNGPGNSQAFVHRLC